MSNVTCRGSIRLGTGCGDCADCKVEQMQIEHAKRQQADWEGAPQTAAYARAFCEALDRYEEATTAKPLTPR